MIMIMQILVLGNPGLIFAEARKPDPPRIGEFGIKFGLTKVAEEANDLLKSEGIDPSSGISPDCSEQDLITTPAENRFDKMKKDVKEACAFFWAFRSEDYCNQVVSDVFEIGSPHCNTGDAGRAASSCTMGMQYLVDQFQGINKNNYIQAIDNLDLIQKKIISGERTLTSTSLFPLVLEATNGNKEIAINLISAEHIGSAGLTSFNNSLKKIPDPQLTILHKWASSGDIFTDLKKKFPEKNLRNVPEEDISSVSASKEYHYWPRAMMAQALLKKGYSESTARAMATATSLIYEFHFDWKEHTEQGESFTSKFTNALADVNLSDRGSIFGSTY